MNLTSHFELKTDYVPEIGKMLITVVDTGESFESDEDGLAALSLHLIDLTEQYGAEYD